MGYQGRTFKSMQESKGQRHRYLVGFDTLQTMISVVTDMSKAWIQFSITKFVVLIMTDVMR